MPRIKNTRKARFEAALKRVDMTQAEWALSNGLTREHLNRVLNRRVISPPVDQKIDAFIAEVEAKVLVA